jgi:hypothetical protein
MYADEKLIDDVVEQIVCIGKLRRSFRSGEREGERGC